jgi:hypothetical protein
MPEYWISNLKRPPHQHKPNQMSQCFYGLLASNISHSKTQPKTPKSTGIYLLRSANSDGIPTPANRFVTGQYNSGAAASASSLSEKKVCDRVFHAERDSVEKPEVITLKVRFEERNGELFINDRKVLHGWESFSGWYWFATEKVQDQVRLIDGKPVTDTIWFGFVQGHFEEWGEFSQAEIESLHPMAWEIPRKNLPWSGRREVRA